MSEMGPRMRIGKRLDELERRAFGRIVRLTMSDGSEQKLPGRRLVSAVANAAQHRFDAPDVRLILGSVADDGALRGQGFLTELVKVLAHAASGAPVGADPLDFCDETVISKETIQ
jgi:hypothetical protein